MFLSNKQQAGQFHVHITHYSKVSIYPFQKTTSEQGQLSG